MAETASASIRIAIADDHPLVLDGLEQLFRLEPDVTVVARCRDADEALKAIRRERPDVLVLDLIMPGGGGLELLRSLAGDDGPMRIVLLTAVIDDDQLLEAIRLGVHGVVLKDMAPKFLVEAVREVHRGAQWLEQGLGGRALRRLLAREQRAGLAARLLSPREREIVRMVASGLRNRAIAEKLGIGEGTVKVHVHNIYEKLDINGRIELSLYARENGLI
jgi:DNA-binding NarL/FixJ family response regulator